MERCVVILIKLYLLVCSSVNKCLYQLKCRCMQLSYNVLYVLLNFPNRIKCVMIEQSDIAVNFSSLALLSRGERVEARWMNLKDIFFNFSLTRNVDQSQIHREWLLRPRAPVILRKIESSNFYGRNYLRTFFRAEIKIL